MRKKKSLLAFGFVLAFMPECLPLTGWAAVSFAVSGQSRVVRAQGLTEGIGMITFTTTEAGTTTTASVIAIRFQPTTHITNNSNQSPSPINVVGSASGFVSIFQVAGAELDLSIPSGVAFPVGSNFSVQGIRLNVSESGAISPLAINAQVFVFPASDIILESTPVPVAIPMPGLALSAGGFPAIIPARSPLPQCVGNSNLGSASSIAVGSPGDTPAGSVVFRAVATEAFADAFKTAAGFSSGDEFTLSGPSEVTNATRLLVRIRNIPAGASVFAPGRVDATLGGLPATSNGLRLTLVKGTDANGARGSLVSGSEDAVTTFSLFPPTADGFVTIVYQIVLASASAIETANIPVAVTNTTNAGLGEAVASVALGPISTIGLAVGGEPIPRFADQPVQGTAFRIIPCATNLLFPWISNQAGFDTGIAISNTSRDPYGTASQNGTITFHFFGLNAPAAPITTATVAAGTTYTAVLSSLASGFQGYVIAIANFQFATGFAFLTGGGNPSSVATGYVATQIPAPQIEGQRVDFSGSPQR